MLSASESRLRPHPGRTSSPEGRQLLDIRSRKRELGRKKVGLAAHPIVDDGVQAIAKRAGLLTGQGGAIAFVGRAQEIFGTDLQFTCEANEHGRIGRLFRFYVLPAGDRTGVDVDPP